MDFMLLPPNVGKVSEVASDSPRKYATNAVKVAQVGETGYRVEATNGAKLLRVEGRCDPCSEYPAAGLGGYDHLKTEALIPHKQFSEACKAAAKIKGRVKPVLRNLAVFLNNDEAKLYSTDLDSQRVEYARYVDRRYPDTDKAIPQGEPLGTISLDAVKLLELLKALTAFTDPTNNNLVDLEFHGSDKPLVLRAKSPTQKVTGMVMGMYIPASEKK